MAENDGIVQISKQLDQIFNIPDKAKGDELRKKAENAQKLLNEWSLSRRHIIQRMRDIGHEVNGVARGCAVSTTVGSSVGILGGIATIVGLVVMPPVAIAGLIVGTAAGASNLVTSLVKTGHTYGKADEVKELLRKDEELFKKLLESRQELMQFIQKLMEEEEFFKNVNGGDYENLLKNVLGGGVAGATGMAAKFAMMSMGRLTSSLVKGILHSAAVIGIVLDGVTLALSAKDLAENKQSELAGKLFELADELEKSRQKVCECFLNNEKWNEE